MQVGGECDGWEYACFLHSSYYRSPRLLSHNSAVEPAVAGPPSCLADCRLRICAGGTFARIRTTDPGQIHPGVHLWVRYACKRAGVPGLLRDWIGTGCRGRATTPQGMLERWQPRLNPWQAFPAMNAAVPKRLCARARNSYGWSSTLFPHWSGAVARTGRSITSVGAGR